MSYSRQLAALKLPHATASVTSAAVPSNQLWIIRGVGFYLPAGGLAVLGALIASEVYTFDGIDSRGASGAVAGQHTPWAVVAAGQQLELAWDTAPSTGNLYVVVSGYEISYP